MKLFPAIDLYEGQVVRLFQGDYQQMTVYGQDPLAVARSFAAAGAEYLHMVDLEGAKSGTTPNMAVVKSLCRESGLKLEIGGGIRSEQVVQDYLEAGVFRVILGTAAVTQPGFAKEMAQKYGDRIAVGVDVREGMVAIKGWTETTDLELFRFCQELEADGITTVICTDISKDGAMAGTNQKMYQRLQSETGLQVVASGGISTLEDIRSLHQRGLYGAILGKALYTGAINLAEALQAAKEGSKC